MSSANQKILKFLELAGAESTAAPERLNAAKHALRCFDLEYDPELEEETEEDERLRGLLAAAVDETKSEARRLQTGKKAVAFFKETYDVDDDKAAEPPAPPPEPAPAPPPRGRKQPQAQPKSFLQGVAERAAEAFLNAAAGPAGKAVGEVLGDVLRGDGTAAPKRRRKA